MSSVLWILESNLHLIIVIDIIFNEDIQITISKTLNRYNINRIAINCNSSNTIVIDQGSSSSSLHQFLHIGCTTEINTDNVRSSSNINSAQGIRTTEVSTELNIIKEEFRTTITW